LKTNDRDQFQSPNFRGFVIQGSLSEEPYTLQQKRKQTPKNLAAAMRLG